MSANSALMLGKLMKNKAMNKGGKCYACGGQVNPKLQESHLAKGGEANEFSDMDLPDDESSLDDVQPMRFAEGGSVQGGGVDGEYDPQSINDKDGDGDDLVYSPEKEAGGVDNEKEDADDDGKKTNFLRAYLIHRRLRG